MDTSRQEEEHAELHMAIVEKDSEMIFLKRKLDKDIGYNYWKKYVSSAFWAQISTPINLIITFLTAITTAQAQTQDLISRDLYSQLAIVSLVITTLNTFFRPHAQFATNTEYLGKWNDIGVHFEKEYCDKVNTQIIDKKTLDKLEKKVAEYKKIQDEVITLRKTEGSGTVNFLTDLIFLIAYSTCIRNKQTWLATDKKIEDATKTKMKTRTSTMKTTGNRNNVVIRILKDPKDGAETPPPPPPEQPKQGASV